MTTRSKAGVWVIVCAAAVALVVFAVRMIEPTPEQVRQWNKANASRTANKVVGLITYIKDPRTDLCFAYLWDGESNGGPALATVPCTTVPPDLLNIATRFPAKK